MTGTTVLLIEDSDSQAEAVLGPLAALGYVVRRAQTGSAGIQSATEAPPDCILLDLQLPDIDGLQVCRFLASRASTREVPIIMLTSRAAVADRIRGLGTGATDYLPKPFDIGELDARIRACVRTVALQDEVQEKNRQLEQLVNQFRVLATTDDLTGLSNRRRFFDELEREVLRHKRYGSPLALALFDIDHFKAVNDEHGHQAGDIVLRDVGKILASAFRRTDVVARYGGEEFAGLLPEASIAEALEAAERLRLHVAAHRFETQDGPLHITISGGLAIAGPATASHDDLVQAADAALYRAKALGRDRIESAP